MKEYLEMMEAIFRDEIWIAIAAFLFTAGIFLISYLLGIWLASQDDQPPAKTHTQADVGRAVSAAYAHAAVIVYLKGAEEAIPILSRRSEECADPHGPVVDEKERPGNQ